MKFLVGPLFLILLTQACKAQYYYKDLVSTRENAAQWQLYRTNKVSSVRLSSFEADGKPTEGFLGEQVVTAGIPEVVTHTKSTGTADSWIITDYSPLGSLIKNTDTSDTYQNASTYRYDEKGRLISISDTSLETDNQFREFELHLWSYDNPAHPEQPTAMLKIKGGNDTTSVRFVLDEQGNVAEERAIRRGANMPVIYYYYNADNRLTDVVRFNIKAQRLLPMKMFEYEDGRLSSALIVPEEGNNFYQKWYYVYDEKGLKAKDFCYNKQKELLGTIEYQYSYK